MADSNRDVNSIIPPEVRELIQEAQKIQGWLERLTDHAADAREAVFAKVHADYETRLQAVSGNLAEHRVQLVEMLETRRGEVESLQADRDEHAAELEETKLRHAVGEYGDREWKERKEKIQESIDDLDELLRDEEATVAELDEITRSIGPAGPRLVADSGAASSEATIETEPAAEGGADLGVEGEAAGVEAASGSGTVTSEETRPDAGEPDSEPASADATAEAANAEDAVEEAEGGEYLDELEFLESLSLGDSERFDAVSAMLEEEEGGKASD